MVWFITVIAFKSVGFCRNNYFKIISNAPSNLICNIWKFIFHSLLQFFDVLSNDIALKGLFLHNCVVFSLFCVAIVIFEPVFERAYFGTDFATIRRNKFPARYFWYKAKLKQKKFILKSWALCFYASYSICSNFRKWFQLSHRTWSHFLFAQHL